MMRRIPRDIRVFVLFVVAVAVFPMVSPNLYYVQLATNVGIFAVAALGLNLVMGVAGQISIGQAGFMGLGAYTVAYFIGSTSAVPPSEAGGQVVRLAALHLPFLLATLIAVLISIPVSLFVGYSALRLRGNYLAMATLAFGGIIYGLILEWKAITGGPIGVRGLPFMDIFGWQIDRIEHPGTAYYVVWVFALLAYLLVISLVKSRLGRAMSAIREDEVAAGSLGINVAGYKVLAFVISGVLASVSGALYIGYWGNMEPYRFGVLTSVTLILMVVVGGMGNMHGALLGVALLIILPEFGRRWETYRLAGYGAFLVLMMVFLPGGIASLGPAIGNILKGRLGRARLVGRGAADERPP